MKQATDMAQNRPLWRLMSTVGEIRNPSSACQKRGSSRRRRRKSFRRNLY